jgi:cystathionine beta-lyase
VYHHLFVAPTNVRRNPITVPLNHVDDHWTFDFERLEAAVTDDTRLFLLCNPHNPVGRMYSREELLAVAEFCEKHDLVLCSDEIHCQLILDKTKQHIPVASLDKAIAERSITLMAPSKTYNLPGLGCSFAVIPNAKLREQFVAAKSGIVPNIAALSFTAALAAYRDSDDWLAALLDYLRGNYALLTDRIAAMPGMTLTPLEATYLGWIDVGDTGLEDPAGFFEQAGVGLHAGPVFKGPGFLRMNFGCPRPLLEQALNRMQQALTELSS